MKIPNKLYDPELDLKSGEMSYYLSSRSKDDNVKYIKLPKWLLELIKDMNKISFENGKQFIQDKIKENLNMF